MKFAAVAFAFSVAALSTSARASVPLADPSLLDLSIMDRGVDPCDDFYQFACGNWSRNNPVPADKAIHGRGLWGLNDLVKEQTTGLIQDLGKQNPDTLPPLPAQLSRYFGKCLAARRADSPTAPNELGGELQRIAAIQSRGDFARALARLSLEGVEAFFGVAPIADPKDATRNIGDIYPAGFNLPSDEYYVSGDSAFAQKRAAYAAYLGRAMAVSGLALDPARIQDLLQLESRLVSARLSPADRGDPSKTVNRTNLAGLQSLALSVDWPTYFSELHVDPSVALNVDEVNYIKAVDSEIRKMPLEALKAYLSLKLVDHYAGLSGGALGRLGFDFYKTTLQGITHYPTPEEGCLAELADTLPEELGNLYASRYFDARSKEMLTRMQQEILKAFDADLDTLDWLDAQTRQNARAKLRLFGMVIGVPDSFHFDPTMTFASGSHFDDVLSAAVSYKKDSLGQIGRPIDRGRWWMPPNVVNAFYSGERNNINLLAAILQPPFFSPTASLASNFGSIGMAMGHETTHGFDPSGSQLDGHGNVSDWWAPATKKAWESKQACFIEQYQSYRTQHGNTIDGALKLNENVADNGGIKMAYLAYHSMSQGTQQPNVKGFTPDQQFFLAFAQSWCTNMTPQEDLRRAKSDVHSEPKLRINVTLTNTPPFARAFGCPAGKPMTPAKTCSAW